MNWLDGFNKVITYMEDHLEEEIDYETLADILGYSVYHFQRLFMMISGVSVAEYIRSRRLSQAAFELLNDNSKVIDVAFKYGYSSPTSFNRAFKAMHGVPPKDIKKGDSLLKAYPPLSFELTMKGASTLDYRIVKTETFTVVGEKLATTMENGICYKALPSFWEEIKKSGKIPQILALMNTPPFGLLGVSDYNPDFSESEFNYLIAVSTDKEPPKEFSRLVIPATTWAAFPHKLEASEKVQNFQHKIVTEWLPTSGYEFTKGPDLEVYNEDGSMETWIPIKKL